MSCKNFGFYGFLLGEVGLAILLCEHRSFGLPYLSSLPLEEVGSSEDSLARAPFWNMQKFGRFLAGVERNRRAGS